MPEPPLVTLTEAEPPVLQLAGAVMPALNCKLLPPPCTLTIATAEQLFTSRTVTLYEPAVTFEMVKLVEPLLQLTVYGPVPPEGETVAEPLLAAQEAGVEEVAACTGVGCVKVTDGGT